MYNEETYVVGASWEKETSRSLLTYRSPIRRDHLDPSIRPRSNKSLTSRPQDAVCNHKVHRSSPMPVYYYMMPRIPLLADWNEATARYANKINPGAKRR